MAIRWFSVGRERFYVESVTGWPITPGSASGGTGRHAGTSSWSVFDSEVMHAEIATFIPGGGQSSAVCKRKADVLCAELNAEELAA